MRMSENEVNAVKVRTRGMLSILGKDFTVSKMSLEAVPVSIAPKLFLNEEKKIFQSKVFSTLLEFLKTPNLNLTNTFSGQIQNFSDLFERDAPAIGNIQSTGIFKLPHI